jgi:2-phosphosulfolactate phosphatase
MSSLFQLVLKSQQSHGAIIFPYRWKDESAFSYALSVNAEVASFQRQSSNGYSLSPSSLIDIPAGAKLVLPSPNGATLSLNTGPTPTLTGCLRNSEAIAQFAMAHGTRIAIIPAGERWGNGSLRPALEDLIGAGAILSYLNGRLSPEAEAAVALFRRWQNELVTALTQCSSGKELTIRGFAKDIELAAAFNTSNCVPFFTHNAYVKQPIH